MKDYAIYKRLRPFILKRIMYAILGLLLMIGVLILATFWGMDFPEYRTEIIISCAIVGVFMGWKIIRNGELRYRLAQVSMVTDILLDRDIDEISSRKAMRMAKSTFKYSSVINLLKNIWRHKNFKKAGQFLTVMTANMIPYLGTCMMAWIFAHPEEEKIKGACHAVTVYYQNRSKLRGKVLKAFFKEIVIVVAAFFLIYLIEFAIFAVIINCFTDLDELLKNVEDLTETIEVVYDWYFERNRGYEWTPMDVMTIIGIYLAWFVKVFSIRAYQMIDIIRAYLKIGEANPPSDDLYYKLMHQWEKTTTKGGKNHNSDMYESAVTITVEDGNPDEEGTEKEGTETEGTETEGTEKEGTETEGTETEATEKATTEKEATEKAATEKEIAERETAEKEAVEQETAKNAN